MTITDKGHPEEQVQEFAKKFGLDRARQKKLMDIVREQLSNQQLYQIDEESNEDVSKRGSYF
jgi:hypothetical protein